MILISNLILSIKEDDSTFASTNIYGEDKITYINIGSGNVFCLEWQLDSLPDNDTLDYFNLIIKQYDPTLDVYYNILDKNVGQTYNFYVNSEILPAYPLQYALAIYVVAYGTQGSAIISNIVNPYVSKGSGAYVKVQPEGYTQPIMKRALAFVKTDMSDLSSPLGLATSDGELLQTNREDQTEILVITGLFKPDYRLADKTGNFLFDKNGTNLSALFTKLLTNAAGWNLVQEVYTRDNDTWHISDIKP